MSATRIFIKLLTESGSAGTLSVTDGLSGVGPPPTLTRSHVFAIWMYCTLARRCCRLCSECDLRRPFRKIEPIVRCGDGKKVCDGKSILRRHLIDFLIDLYLVRRGC